MTSISLGPLALPTAPLLLLLAATLAIWLANRLSTAGGPARDGAGTELMHALLAGLVVARLVHLGLHLDAYRSDPWAALDLRDGGWHAPAGLVAGLGWIARRAARRPGWRKALAAGTAAGLVAWGAGTAGLAALAPQQLPDLALTDLASGQPVRLHDVARDRPVVLNLWATWCAPCRKEMPVLAAAQDQHPEVLFVFANQGEGAAIVNRYLQAERLALHTVLLDSASQLGPAVGSRGLPTTAVYDRQGRRVDIHMGLLNAAALAAMIEPVAAPKAQRAP
jgi:thiol-disulfide isomerase/thioredoxin